MKIFEVSILELSNIGSREVLLANLGRFHSNFFEDSAMFQRKQLKNRGRLIVALANMGSREAFLARVSGVPDKILGPLHLLIPIPYNPGKNF